MGRPTTEAVMPDYATNHFQYAKALARYISDPSTIRARTLDHWGRAPTVDQCRNLRHAQEETRNRFRKSCDKRATELVDRRLSDETKFQCGHPRTMENTELSGENEKCRKCQNAKREALATRMLTQAEALEAQASGPECQLAAGDMRFAHHLSAKARVLALAAHINNMSVADILSKSRFRQHVRARWQVMLALRSVNMSLPVIVEAVGIKDHTTAVYAMRQGAILLAEDEAFAASVDRLKAIARAQPPKVDADVVAQFMREGV